MNEASDETKVRRFKQTITLTCNTTQSVLFSVTLTRTTTEAKKCDQSLA
jgi:hypothetical protein